MELGHERDGILEDAVDLQLVVVAERAQPVPIEVRGLAQDQDPIRLRRNAELTANARLAGRCRPVGGTRRHRMVAAAAGEQRAGAEDQAYGVEKAGAEAAHGESVSRSGRILEGGAPSPPGRGGKKSRKTVGDIDFTYPPAPAPTARRPPLQAAHPACGPVGLPPWDRGRPGRP